MFTRTCRGAFIAALLILQGCGEFPGFSLSRKVPDRVILPDGLVVAGDKGWCVDQRTSQTRTETAVVVMGNCAALSKSADFPQPAVRGLLAITVNRGEAPKTDVLQAYFDSADGRSRLAQDGQAGSVELIETLNENGALYLQVLDKSLDHIPGVAKNYWRVLFGLGGRLVSVALLTDEPVSREVGLSALTAQVMRLRLENQAQAEAG